MSTGDTLTDAQLSDLADAYALQWAATDAARCARLGVTVPDMMSEITRRASELRAALVHPNQWHRDTARTALQDFADAIAASTVRT